MNNNLFDLWQKTLQVVKNEVTDVSYDTWIRTLEPLTIVDDDLYLSVPNDLTKSILERRYSGIISNAVKQITNIDYNINLILENDADKFLGNKDDRDDKQSEFNYLLNPKYVFETFVIGNSNRFAHAASLAVAEAPAKAYNPLFIYGGVGLGKTHLMHAIAHYILSQNPNSKVLYVSSEKFTNELITSIQTNKNTEFRDRYRNVDVLLVDDIQFIAGKESTQEEFFHTFNALHESDKQIIISSDRPPKEIPTLEDRLRSRFEWGLIADIQPPDLETRVAILRKKVEVENLEVDDDVLLFIANRIDSNIRELEGALTRIVAYTALTNSSLTVSVAEEALKDIISNHKVRKITPELIQKVVAEYYQLKIEDFKSKKRNRSIAFPRQIAMYLCRELTDMSLPKIGTLFGGRDHTTVIHACEKISKELESDLQMKRVINELKKRINEN